MAQILKEAAPGVAADKSRYKYDPEFPELRAKIEANLAETEETYPNGHYTIDIPFQWPDNDIPVGEHYNAEDNPARQGERRKRKRKRRKSEPRSAGDRGPAGGGGRRHTDAPGH